MKKFKLLSSALLAFSMLSFVSCGLIDKLNEEDSTTIVDTTTKKTSTQTTTTKSSTTTTTRPSTTTTKQITTTSTKTTTTTSKQTTTTTNKKMKYEVGTPQTYLWTDSIGYKWMKVAIPVTNTGDYDIYLSSSSYDVETKSGSLLDTEDYVSGYPQYLKPGETGYYYDETSRDFTETNINIVPNLDIIKGTNQVVRYEISDVSITTDSIWGVKVIGRVKNNTSTKGTFVEVVALLFDNNNKLISQLSDTLDNDLAAGAKASFEMTPFSYRAFTANDVARYEIYAYPYEYEFDW